VARIVVVVVVVVGVVIVVAILDMLLSLLLLLLLLFITSHTYALEKEGPNVSSASLPLCSRPPAPHTDALRMLKPNTLTKVILFSL
jgi:hypothetical protein